MVELTPTNVDQLIAAIAFRLAIPTKIVKKSFQLDVFTYDVYIATLTASATVTGQFTVQADSAFAITSQIAIITDTSNAAVSGLQPYGSGALTSLNPFLVLLTDSGAGRNLSLNPVHIDAQFGTSQRPYVRTVPKILDPNSSFSIAVENLTATDRRGRFYFHGYKIFGNLELFLSVRT